MKATVLYHSKTGNTQRLAQWIAEGLNETEGMEARTFAIEQLDEAWLAESQCVLLGTPTYYADLSGAVKTFLEGCGQYRLAGKLGGAFASAAYVHGGAELAIQNILTHMLFFGMMVYSGGSACGAPPIHLGPVGIDGAQQAETFRLFGRRMAQQALRLWEQA